jgi:hypothetical protein
LKDEATKLLEVKTQLQIEKDKALAELAELQTKLHQAHHDIKTEKVTAQGDICKGNLAVLRLITQASKGGSKVNI